MTVPRINSGTQTGGLLTPSSPGFLVPPINPFDNNYLVRLTRLLDGRSVLYADKKDKTPPAPAPTPSTKCLEVTLVENQDQTTASTTFTLPAVENKDVCVLMNVPMRGRSRNIYIELPNEWSVLETKSFDDRRFKRDLTRKQGERWLYKFTCLNRDRWPSITLQVIITTSATQDTEVNISAGNIPAIL